ncbi:LLM class flavin-dependent oxidoreductase [Nocardia sp. NPDC052566]|uniref:LLM class flavin-dependent oxidoreductase n=1 Tax=Nocardia sp. NPDC052566 TaxID=3364330 RepID=UPI0037CC7888
MTVPLSVLDLAPVRRGIPPSHSLRESVSLAPRVEELGYLRYWLAEHHNLASVASCAPSVLIAEIANATTVLRVGSGGVMLPDHAPLVVAEQFGTLEALHPGRIDLGVGRAPGTDPRTARALRRTEEPAGFPRQLDELVGYFNGSAAAGAIKAIPAEGNAPPIWILGSSVASAEFAAVRGLPYAFAHHIAPGATIPALRRYRESFQPGVSLQRPYAIVAAISVVADTDEHAAWVAQTLRAAATRARRGEHAPYEAPTQAAALPYTADELVFQAEYLSTQIIGGPAEAHRRATELVTESGADELMILAVAHEYADRVRTYEVLAEELSTGH